MKSMILLLMNGINFNVAVVENVARWSLLMVRPLVEAFNWGHRWGSGWPQFWWNRVWDSSSSSSLTPIRSSPRLCWCYGWEWSPPPPPPTSSPPSLPPPSCQVGSRYEGRSLCAKAKGSRRTDSVRQSPLLKPLSRNHVLAQVIASKPKGSGLRRSASLAELELYISPSTVAFNFLTLNVNGILDPMKRAGLL